MTQIEPNKYAGMTEYYDLWVTSGYYNYEVMAKAAYDIAGAGRKVLELGVGTGLLVEEYLKLDSTCDFTGVDFAPAMLEIAYQRLPKEVRLEEADAVTMDLQDTYDVAISNGGVWGILDLGETWEFGGHVPGIEANREGLQNLARHLNDGGLLLLHRQTPHQNYDKTLPGDIIYTQHLEEIENTPDYYCLQKDYFFKKDGELLAQDQVLITCFKPEMSQQLLTEAGFERQGISEGGHFVIYQVRK